MDDELEYRTPINSTPALPQVSSTDEQNFDTLQKVQADFVNALAGLYKDFNAFKLLKDATTEVARDNLLRQIQAKQEAYDILSPLLDTLNGTLESINLKYRSQ